MFRKTIHILLIALLLVSTMGFSLSKHYCGTRLVDVKINSEAESCCGGNSCESNCCHNETVHLQLKDNFVGSVNFELNSPAPSEILFSIDFFQLKSIAEADGNSIFMHVESPPPKLVTTRLSEIQSYLL